ncbi:unnamed protein product [Didymodactylos carnosus]|uniref:Integrase catalytic domain-containing protein n=1 Tax=Didymodactylos carnosus TaxID=1234261 RepID=A0A815XHL2_9BILA|nr:unnamed protein product [Didymodactylos carnosus]CAF4419257.1 unnamed protein product [Didymodactylos carnosus]
MPDYLSRYPVDDAEEDPDDIILTSSKSTQTHDELNSEFLSIVAAVQTRSATRQSASNNPSTKITPLQTTEKTMSLDTTNYAPHRLNGDPEVLSRENYIIPFTLEQLKEAQHDDLQLQDIMRNIKNHKKYLVQNDILMRRTFPPVPYVPQGGYRSSILKIYHDTSANGAHFGRDRTIEKIKKRYFWPSMNKDIANYVQSCIPCAQFNPRRQKPPGALKPIKPPDGVWQLLTMDFHGPISPTSKRGNKYIISLTDVLSKFVVARAVRDCSAQTAARFLKEDIITKYGTPRCILTDNGSHFTAKMMDELFQQIGVTHLYSTPYHPQTNGQIERYNSTMDAKIAALSNEQKTDWDDQLPFVTFNYNTALHATTKQIPFEMMYGRSPILPFDHQDPTVSLTQDPEHCNKLNKYLSSLTEQAKQNISKSQQQYKQRYDANRSNPKYNIGDLILVKTLNPRHKFDIRHEGPFKIVQQLGPKTFIIEHVKKTTLQRQVTVDAIIPLFQRTPLP